MNELKTLKDFEDYGMDDETRGYELCKKDLRQEAIQWIKELENIPADFYMKRYNLPNYQITENIDGVNTGIIDVVEWIKHFFNISENDLK